MQVVRNIRASLVGQLLAILALTPHFSPAAAPLPSSAVASNYFYTLQSNATARVWIAPPTWRVMRDTAPPTVAGAGIDLSAARNEYEPVQIVVHSTLAGTRSLDLGATWTGPAGNLITATLHDVSYGAAACAAGNPDQLNPIAFGAGQPVCPGSNQVFWLTVFVPANAVAGSYTNTITCTLPGVTTNFPIRIHVFNFTLPAETSFGSLVNWSFSGTPGDAFEMKKWLHQHRLTPRLPTWPSAMQYNITWDTGANPSPCTSFYDEGDQPAVYSIRSLAHEFVAGVGFNDGVGFPNFVAQQYFSGTQPRPSTFCAEAITGDPRGVDYGTSAYNAAWGNYLNALQNYCDPVLPPAQGGNPFGHDYLSKALYLVMNEPQNPADYNLAAWLAQLSRRHAPRLRLMLSEEAKPEIYDNPLYPGQGYDVWLAHLPTYATAIGNALVRKRDHGEQTWWYSVPGDPPHFISPNQTDRPAIETRILTWLAWNQRVQGWSDSGMDQPLATFLGGSSFAPTLRSELLREALEDYEYFKLANGRQEPTPFQPNAADPFVSLIASSLTGFDRDPSKLHWLRHQLGRQISGVGATAPLLPVYDARPYGSYYINFQGTEPTASPLVHNGHTWMKVGWQLFDPVTNFGWFVTETNNLFSGYGSGGNELQRSYLYDDFGRQTTFVFGVANGVYDVEVGMGRPTGTSTGLVTVNGVDVFGDRRANWPQPITNNLAKTQRIALANGWLIMEVGQQINGDYNFTDYLALTAVSPASPDGLDDLWQTAHFGSATNQFAAPGVDPDGDGAVNALEFHCGTNPNSAVSRPSFTATLPAPDRVQLQWTSATSHVFRVEQSDDLSVWGVALAQVPALNPTTTVTLPRATSAAQGFYRVIPLAP